MKLFVFLVFTLALAPATFAAGSACSDLFIAKAEHKKHSFEPILYSVSRDGVTSYVFGVFHQTVDSESFPFAMQRAVFGAKFFLNEVDPTQVPPMSSFFSAKDLKLTSAISKSAWEKVQAILPGIPENVLPVLPYVQFMEASMKTAIGQPVDPQILMDFKLREFAVLKRVPVFFLDDVNDVIQRYAAGVTPELLEWTLNHLDQTKFADSFRRQRDAYLAGDIDTHSRLFESAHEDFKIRGLLESLVKERNRKWVKQLIEFHTRGTFFFAVGVGHLGGNGNLLENLKANGFVVSRITTDTPQ